jgi:hypothetical protein
MWTISHLSRDERSVQVFHGDDAPRTDGTHPSAIGGNVASYGNWIATSELAELAMGIGN